MATKRKYLRLAGSLLNVGTSEETTLQLPLTNTGGGGDIYMLRSFHFVKTGGSASTWQPKLGQSAAFSSGGIDERVSYAAAGNSINEVFSAEVPVKTDGTGKLYFRPGFNTGSDNDADYEFFFELM
mgnify:FL=1